MSATATVGCRAASGALTALALLLFLAVDVTAAASCWSTFPKGAREPAAGGVAFSRCQVLAPSVALYWTVDKANRSITVGVDHDGDQWAWLGFGLSEAGGMRGMDAWVVTAEPSAEGGFRVLDAFVLETATPVPDAQQDVRLVAAGRGNGTTYAVLTRALETCDDADLAIRNGSSHAVTWARGRAAFGYHGPANRGNGQVTFIPAPGKPPSTPTNAKQLSLTMRDFEVPTNDTAYVCTNFELPRDRKYHIIEWEPLLSNASQKLVHHMVVYVCPGRPSLGDVYECSSMGECVEVFVVWAPGGGVTRAPAVAGLPIGKGFAQYIALQMHYTNPSGEAGVRDSSGFRFTYTRSLRKHDLGLLTLGRTDFVVPPGQPDYALTPGVCGGSTCTKNFGRKLTVVGTILHMHTLGKTIDLTIVRGGRALAPLAKRSAWDFGFQARMEPDINSNTIRPGDSLVTRCTYDSTSRTTDTTYGESTSNEMCFAFVSYYPRMPTVDICLRNDWGLGPTAIVETCTTQRRLEAFDTVSTQDEFLSLVQSFVAHKRMSIVPDLGPTAYTPYNLTQSCLAARAPHPPRRSPPPRKRRPPPRRLHGRPCRH